MCVCLDDGVFMVGGGNTIAPGGVVVDVLGIGPMPVVSDVGVGAVGFNAGLVAFGFHFLRRLMLFAELVGSGVT